MPGLPVVFHPTGAGSSGWWGRRETMNRRISLPLRSGGVTVYRLSLPPKVARDIRRTRMQQRQWLWIVLGVSAALALGTRAAQAQTSPLKNPEQGSPAVQSIEAISFAPEGVLLIGDGRGKQVVAVDTGDTKLV